MQYSSSLAVILLLCIVQTGLAATDVAVAWTSMEATYNPSLVEYGGTYLSALKRTTFARGRGKTFWVNHLYICVGANTDLAGMRCRQYYPWTEKYHECEFDKRVRGGKVDVTGLGDVKVWVWPGKGVYAIFGRKPERTLGGGPYCTSQVVYDQWIAQVRPEATAGEWRLSQPLRLYAQGFNYSPSEPFIMEKVGAPMSAFLALCCYSALATVFSLPPTWHLPLAASALEYHAMLNTERTRKQATALTAPSRTPATL